MVALTLRSRELLRTSSYVWPSRRAGDTVSVLTPLCADIRVGHFFMPPYIVERIGYIRVGSAYSPSCSIPYGLLVGSATF